MPAARIERCEPEATCPLREAASTGVARVAIAHLHAKIFSRGKGHSALSKAAYRSGSKLYDERLGRTWDYERKNHVEETGILAPSGAPDWVFERETLWNTVEQCVRRKDSQLARELEISFPRELSPDQQQDLLRAFLDEHFVSRGMVADYALHRPPGNPHAHVMLTMYELHEDGFGKKVKDWDSPKNVTAWREAWEVCANRALANAGRAERIDMRSYSAQGIDLEPQPKIGRAPTAAHIDGRDVVAEALVAYQLAARRNGERIAKRPALVLELLSSKRSSFSERDLLRALHRYTADAEQFARVRTIVEACPELVELTPDEKGARRFSTREVIQREQALLASAHTLAQRGAHVVRTNLIDQAIRASRLTLTDEQAAAVKHVTASGDLAIVEGYAGTGKSTMLAAARAAWEALGLVVVGGALAGKAAEGLADPSSAGIASRTLASWQYNWAQGRELLTSRHVLVIDEAGMVGTRELERVLAHARDAGAKVVLVGDTRQLQSIEPGAPMRQLLERYEAARLAGVIRQKDHLWQAQATLAFAEGRAQQALESYGAAERLLRHETAEQARSALVTAWDQNRRAHPTDSAILLAYRRRDVRELNILARELRRQAGELGSDHALPTRDGERSFASGDRVYFLKNDRELGVTNGTLGTIERIQGTVLTVRLDSHRQVAVDLSTYDALDHGYAATIHKSQGVTVDRSYVLASKYMDSAASYVALSRHRKDAFVFYDAEEFGTETNLIRRLARERVNPNALDAPSPILPSTEHLDQQLREERAFLELEPSVQQARLEALRLACEQKPLSAAEVFERLPEVQEATRRRDSAADALSVATRQLGEFEEQHRVATTLRTAAYQEHLADVARREREFVLADRFLKAVRTDPERRAFAESTASRHNKALRKAQQRLRWCTDLQQRQARDEALARYAAAANTQAGAARFRIATREDEGRTFQVVLKRAVRNDPVLILKAEGKGPLVIADARLCAGDPAVGSRVVLGEHTARVAEKEKSHDDRSRD